MKKNAIIYVVIVLIIFGIFQSLWSNPANLILPAVIFGLIFLLYKYPPRRWRNRSVSRRKKERERKKQKFSIISGNKETDRDESPPPYH